MRALTFFPDRANFYYFLINFAARCCTTCCAAAAFFMCFRSRAVKCLSLFARTWTTAGGRRHARDLSLIRDIESGGSPRMRYASPPRLRATARLGLRRGARAAHHDEDPVRKEDATRSTPLVTRTKTIFHLA